MILTFERSFLKDIKGIGQDSVKQKIEATINKIRIAKSIIGLTSVKKLTDHKNAYRIRIG